MREFNFESEEVKNYYEQAKNKYHMGTPNWSGQQVITKEDVDSYIKDAENILQC